MKVIAGPIYWYRKNGFEKNILTGYQKVKFTFWW